MNGVLLALLALAAAAVQLTLPFYWLPMDLTVLLAVFAGLWRGSGTGLLTGCAAGLAMDSIASPLFGVYALSTALAGGIADLLHDDFNKEQVFAQAFATGSLTLVHDLALWQAARWFALPQVGLEVFFAYYALPKVALHIALAAPLFFFLKQVIRPSDQGRFRGVPKMIRTLPR